MANPHLRGGDAHMNNLHSSDSDGRDSGDLLNAIGSASSLGSTDSSVFSTNSLAVRSNGNILGAATLTPLTQPSSSPSKPRSPFPAPKSHHRHSMAHPSSSRSLPTHFAPSQNATPYTSSPRDRPHARSRQSANEGYRADNASEENDKLSKEEKSKYTGEAPENNAPPDPRLSIVGYGTDTWLPRPAPNTNPPTSKVRLRLAPRVRQPYRHDSKLTWTPSPTKHVVVTFNPVTPETQIRTLFGSFGAIAELRNEIDPTNGSLLGICSIKYRDSNPIRGTSILAANAAKRAVKEGHGERIGQNQIRVELDREGRKSRRYIDNVLKRTRARLEKERVHNALKPHVEPAQAHLPAPTPTNDTPAPPANAPKGPSAKSNRPADGVLQDAIEKEPILGKIKRKPYVFLKAASVKASTTTLPHLKKKLRACDWREVRVDSTGYYIIFEDSKRGEDETLRCFETFNGDKLFTYEMELECQQYGNPNYERSPSPETQVAVNRKRAEEERLRLEELEDLEEEKRQRAADLDPVIGALQQVRADLLQMVMNDIKSRVAIPTFYDQLDPSQHAAKRQELDLPDPSENEKSIPAMMLNKAGETPPGTPRARQGQRTSKPLRPHDPIAQRGRLVSTNAYIDERRAKRPAPRNLHRPLAFQFQQASGGDEDDSDDEQNTPATRDTPDQDSRPPSRASRTSTPFGDSEPVDAPRHKRRKLEHKGNMHTEGAWDGDDEPEVFDSFHKQMLGDILQKEPEIMATRELELVVNTLPRTSKFQQRARTELFLRQRNRYDDDLFRPTSDETSESTPIPTVEVTAESGATDAASSVSKKSKKKPRKTKKQIFEEREALKAATKAVADSEVLEEDAMDQIEEKEAELDAAEEVSEEPTNPEVDWSVSADKPRRTVEDDPNLVMDIDGWQHIIKDEEDLKFARMALEKFEEWDIGDPEKWAATQKEIKFLNTGIRGPTTVECKIQGYYKPNPSGCARLEPYKKILESEKSKYLPHRLKVQKAREEREAQAKENPNAAATAEAAKQAAAAKTASTTSSRSNRANNRRLVNDIKLQKSSLGTSGAETDTMRFNQLKKRKKNVKFDRSAIHGWGLYAMENIAYNDLIIEYVGELVRQKVADLREQQYEKQGVGSSYLFRMADDEIVDATKKGGIARFINHSCSPNCTARIIKVEGTRRIVIYALKDIAKGDELTYDYKFEREFDSTDRIPCLCGTVACKGFLN